MIRSSPRYFYACYPCIIKHFTLQIQGGSRISSASLGNSTTFTKEPEHSATNAYAALCTLQRARGAMQRGTRAYKRENLGTWLIIRPLFSSSHAPCPKTASRPRRHQAILLDLNGRHEGVTVIILCR